MRFSKLMMSLVLLASIAMAAVNASASSSCNARDGSARGASTNPPAAKAVATINKAIHGTIDKVKSSKFQGRK